MKRRLRRLVLRSSEALGINRLLLGSRWRSQRLLILCYHGFSLRDEHQWDPQLFVSGATFRRRLQQLRESRCHVLPLGEAVERLKLGTLPPRAVSLTVDDGLYDFSAVAYPLLQEFGYPATVYAATYYVEHPWPVFNVMVSYLLWLAAKRGVKQLRLELTGGEPLALGDPATKTRSTERIKALANERLSGAEKEALLHQVAHQLGVDYAELLDSRILSLMRPQEIRALDPAVADIQLHTHRHRVPEDRQLFLREINDNREALVRAGRPGAGLVHFCYPSGVHRRAFLPWLEEAGVKTAVTSDSGLASADSELLLLPRLVDTELGDPIEFAALLSGLRGLLRRRPTVSPEH